MIWLKIKLLFKTYCSDFELVEIYKILSTLKDKNFEIDNIQQLKSKITFVKEIRKINPDDFLLYLDKDYQGFSYGQVLNSEIVRSFFRGKTLPRIIVLNPTRLKEDSRIEINFENYFENKPELEPQTVPKGKFIARDKNIYKGKEKRKMG